MAETAGSLSRMAVDSATPFDANSFWAEFDSEGIAHNQPTINSDGIRGTRMADSSRNRRSGLQVGGSVNLAATVGVLNTMLPYVLGAAESTDVFDVEESLPSLQMLLDKKFDIYLYSNGKVGGMTLSGEQNQPIKAAFDIEFENYAGGQSWPGTLAQPDQFSPFFFADAAKVTLLSTAREIFGFEVRVDNALSADQWGQNLTRDSLIIPTNRIVTVNLTVSGDSSNNDLLSHTLAGEAVDLALTNADESGSVCTISFGRVHFQRAVPLVGGKGPLRYQLQGVSRGYRHPGTAGHVPDISIEVNNA